MIKKGFTFLQSKKANTLLKFSNKAFTLVEVLVVIGILSIAGVLVLAIFSSTLRGNNKSQILISIKQNGQSVLENLTNPVRNADRVVCPSVIPPATSSDPSTTIVVVNAGTYKRYRFTTPTSLANGKIEQETFQLPQAPPAGSDPNLFIRDFEKTLCSDPSINPQIITDTNSQSGISVASLIFTRNRVAGFKDGVSINFSLSPAVKAPPSVAGQIDPVTFETTIQLR